MTPPHITSPRLLFYAVNGLGLGHVTRLLAIARAVRSQIPAAQILFVTTTEADSVIYKEGFASVKIPSRTIIRDAQIRPAVYNKLAHSVVMNTVAAFNPAILVADTFPTGASQELLPTLSWEMKRVFVYRAQQAERARDSFFQSALAHYYLGIIPHEEGSEEIVAPGSLPLVWTGPIMIRDRLEALSREDARQRLNLPQDGKLLYATVGEGGDDEMAQAEGMIFDAARQAGWQVAAPEAPLLKGGAAPAAPDFRVAYYPMAECFAAFDAAVSAGGYNSFTELMHFGVPTLFIPRTRGFDDQFARCDTAANACAALVAPLEAAEIQSRLAELIDGDLRAKMAEAGRNLVPRNNASRAAEAILGLL